MENSPGPAADAGPVNDPGLLEIPLYHERFFAYVSPTHPAYAQDSIRVESLFGQPFWIIKDGIHEAKLNAVVDAVKSIIPGPLLENILRQGQLKL